MFIQMDNSMSADKLICLATGFAVMLNVAKPVANLNYSYLEKRWRAAVAGAGLKPIEFKTVGGNSIDVTVLNHVSKYMNIDQVVDRVRKPPVNKPRPYPEFFKQAFMIFQGFGMTAISSMKTFVVSKESQALFLEPVAVQAAKFKDAMEAAHGENFEFLRLTRPHLLHGLEIRSFPDLYVAAMESRKSRGQLTEGSNFVVSSKVATSMDKEVIKKMAKRSISAGKTINNVTKAALVRIGFIEADLVRAQALTARGVKRPREEESDEEGIVL